MAKTLCEWKKSEILDDIEVLEKIVSDPHFVCRKCARSAHAEKHLCKPIALPDRESKQKKADHDH